MGDGVESSEIGKHDQVVTAEDARRTSERVAEDSLANADAVTKRANIRKAIAHFGANPDRKRD